MTGAGELLAHGNLVAVPLVLGAGLVSGFNPCCLAMYPAATAACCAPTYNQQRRVGLAALFVLGAALSTSALGVVAALFGRAMGQLGAPVLYVIAFVPMVMGFQLLGWLRLPFRQLVAMRVASSAGTALVAGMMLAVAMSPCSTPILAGVLSYVAFKQSIGFGTILLFAYGVGSSAPVALLGSTAGSALKRWGSPRSHAILDSATGVLLIVTSFYLLWRV